MHLSGLPARVYYHSEVIPSELWEKIRAADINDFAMHSSTPDSEQGDKDIVKGLV
jgi:hypothetical protein